MRQAEPVGVRGGAESAEHQVGTADKVVHLDTAACSVCGINHLCSPAPGSRDSSREEQSVKPTAALDLPPLTLGCTKTASQHGRDALTPNSQVRLDGMLAQQSHQRHCH